MTDPCLLARDVQSGKTSKEPMRIPARNVPTLSIFTRRLLEMMSIQAKLQKSRSAAQTWIYGRCHTRLHLFAVLQKASMSRFPAPFTSREPYLQSLSSMHNPVPSDKNVRNFHCLNLAVVRALAGCYCCLHVGPTSTDVVV